jgi:hypothetical protein
MLAIREKKKSNEIRDKLKTKNVSFELKDYQNNLQRYVYIYIYTSI